MPGNRWFICTLWLAEWYAETARTAKDLDQAKELLKWTCDHALPSGVLAEQVHPYSGAPLSVSPLTWSHAALIAAVHAYLRPGTPWTKQATGNRGCQSFEHIRDVANVTDGFPEVALRSITWRAGSQRGYRWRDVG